MREAQSKHRLSEWLWVHCVLQVKDNMENSQQPVIVCTNQVLSEREASVMRANSWLYHYYMVQSKLQYGLAYEAHAASRMAAAAAAAYYHPHPHPPAPPPPPPHPQVMSPYPHHDPSHHSSYLHHHHHQMSPAPSGVVPTHHHPHSHHHGLNGSATGQHHHHQLQHPTDSESPECPVPTSAQPPDFSTYRYGRRTEAEPVDYSISHSSDEQGEERYQETHLLPLEEVRTPPSASQQKRKSLSSHNALRNKLELIKSPSLPSPRSSPSMEVIVDLDRGGGGGGGTVLVSPSPMVTALQHPLGRPRVLVKAAMIDPAEFMEQWNPSPPWSDTTVQKVPDIIHQDLSPYMTTTPPTPTGTPGSGSSNSGGGGGGSSLSHQPPHTAFTFDWTPEQYVPNLQSATSTARTTTGTVPISEEEQFHLMGVSVPPMWPSEHRLFPLQPPPPPRLGLQPTMSRLEPETAEQVPAKGSSCFVYSASDNDRQEKNIPHRIEAWSTPKLLQNSSKCCSQVSLVKQRDTHAVNIYVCLLCIVSNHV
ncbi:hypothetical protein C0J52_25871 [Blattella germanica]|nr:hypothetical protein C0J52_25871 [Blattella germanica]